MSLSEPFIRRPVATTLLTVGIALAGGIAYFKLPVAPLPQVDFPTISVSASMAGASPDVMAATVATPLERHLGQIADVSEMTSQSSTGATRVVLQFGLDRDIDGAARDVEAAINAARADLPTALRSNPTYRKVQSCRRAGPHPDSDLQDPHRRAAVRRRRHHPRAEALAGERRSARSRSAAARCRRCASS